MLNGCARGGANLMRHLTTLYAKKQLTAKDFAITCHWCNEARVQGADFSRCALGPNEATGNYQKKIDRALGLFPHQYHIDTPMVPKSQTTRVVRKIPMNPIHEAVAREIRADPTILEKIKEQTWPPAYEENPAVQKARENGTQLPVPLALYLDGVRYTSNLAGRADSVIGFWIYTPVTEKRHYIMSLRAADLCDCGCHGWCTLYPTMVALAWSLRALLAGQRPATRHDGSPWDPNEPLEKIRNEFGTDLPQAVLVWLKGDWAEVHHSLGLPSVNSHHCPCPYCTAQKPEFHVQYRDLDFVEKPFA